MTRRARIEAGLLGAYVADAAALGFHWLYDPVRIAQLAGAAPAFRPPDPKDFEGYKGVFVHHGKRAGDLSQYGAQIRVAVQSMNASKGVFDAHDFQDRFAATFGPGGSWIGYIDKATKGTLANLAADRRDPSGADDDQVPAIARFPAVMARSGVTDAQVAATIAITSANETAAAWGPSAAALVSAAYAGHRPRDAALKVAGETSGTIGEVLRSATDDSKDQARPIRDIITDFAGHAGRACPLPQAMPVIFAICARATSYRDAIECNILAGGDSCGRAPVLGAVFGAAHGIGEPGVPLSWIAKLDGLADLTDEAASLAELSV